MAFGLGPLGGFDPGFSSGFDPGYGADPSPFSFMGGNPFSSVPSQTMAPLPTAFQGSPFGPASTPGSAPAWGQGQAPDPLMGPGQAQGTAQPAGPAFTELDPLTGRPLAASPIMAGELDPLTGRPLAASAAPAARPGLLQRLMSPQGAQAMSQFSGEVARLGQPSAEQAQAAARGGGGGGGGFAATGGGGSPFTVRAVPTFQPRGAAVHPMAYPFGTPRSGGR